MIIFVRSCWVRPLLCWDSCWNDCCLHHQDGDHACCKLHQILEFLSMLDQCFHQRNLCRWTHKTDRSHHDWVEKICLVKMEDFQIHTNKHLWTYKWDPPISTKDIIISLSCNVLLDNWFVLRYIQEVLKSTVLIREAFRKKLDILWQPANFNCHLPTLPNYDIKIYDKAVII